MTSPFRGFPWLVCSLQGAAIIEIGKQTKCSSQRAQTAAGFDDLQPVFVVRL
jgi:hypothetical protein